MILLSQIIGWLGAILVIVAYGLVSYKKVDGGSRIYQGMNLFGAIGVGFNSFFQQAWPSFSIQIVWGIIAILALIKSKKIRDEKN